MPPIEDFLKPLDPSLSETQSLDAALESLDAAGSDFVLVRDLTHRPVGLITRSDLERLRVAGPSDWDTKRCASLVERAPRSLQADDSLESAIDHYRSHGVRPVVVFREDEAVGVLDPSDVFQWGAQRAPELIEEFYGQPGSDAPR